jgi:hypothetical protein
MLPVKSLRLDLGSTLAADPATLAPVALGNMIRLVASPFTPNEDLTLAGLTLATFTGSAAKTAGIGAQDVGVDPATGLQSITILEPAGGWRWQCTVTPAVPETIFGYILTDNAGAVLLAAQLLPSPVAISASGQFIEIGTVRLTFVLTPMS